MKKVVFATFLTLFISPLSFLTPAAHSAVIVKITEPTHRLSNGVFIDDLMAQKLQPEGELGKLVYQSYRGVRSWQVDPATISEIVAMSNGYGVSNGQTPLGQQVAKDWLTQFLKVSKFEKVYALNYANASTIWLKKVSPDQIEYLNAIGKIQLDSILSRASDPLQISNNQQQKLGRYEQSVLTYGQRQINLLSTLVDKKELDPLQLRLAQLLNPNIDKQRLEFLVRDFDKLITQYRGKLKISGSKFTITSEKEELPITVINNFKSTVKVKLSTRIANNKIVVGKVDDIQISGGEKQQLLLPVQTLASGSSGLLAQLTNLENKPVGYPVNISLNLAVISPVATWITLGAAILLIVAALLQSWRRVRRRKNV